MTATTTESKEIATLCSPWFKNVTPLFFILLLSSLLTVSARPARALEISVSDLAGHRQIALIEVPAGMSFQIRYIHSVDKTPIFEQFRADPAKGLILEKTWFKMFGAGLGHWPGHGILTQNKDWITIDHIEQVLGSFILRIGSPGVDHTLIYKNQRINLSELAPGVRALVAVQHD